jgi:hypothetical protein
MTERTLDQKLARIRAGRYRPTDFIIADAKDGDMGGGAGAPGPELDAEGRPTVKMRPMAAYRAAMDEMTRSGLVDVMLTSLSSAEVLAEKGTYAASPAVTPAIRLNDATDIWALRGAAYREHPARPFRTARLDRARRIADLGLYAITFYNDPDRDTDTLRQYALFREEAGRAGMRHFLEVFNPAFPVATGKTDFGLYVNDCIARCLAGVAAEDRPLFLKMPYNGPQAMAELAAFDPEHLVVGILGGAAGTTRDTFELVAQGERHGARVALFGRKIYFAESQLEIVRCMRAVVEKKASPADAVGIYHAHLAERGIAPRRTLAEDSQVTEAILKDEA